MTRIGRIYTDIIKICANPPNPSHPRAINFELYGVH